MLKDERQQWILDKIKKDKKATLVDLSRLLNVSYDSIRRDIIELEEKGLLRKVHGAAIDNTYLTMQARQELGIPNEEIVAIVKKAIRFIKPRQIILMDGGSTNLYIAEQFPQDIELTVVTNNPPLAMALSKHANVEVILLGGKFNKRYQITGGHESLEQLKYIKVDLYFMGVIGAHLEDGLTLRDYEESIQKRLMLASAKQVIVCATSEKLGATMAHQICGVNDIHFLITPFEAYSPQLAEWHNKVMVI